MFRTLACIAFGLCVLTGCNGNDDKKEAEKEGAAGLSGKVETTSSFQLTDAGLLNNKDTATVSALLIQPFITDSILSGFFGKTKTIRYVPLAKVQKEGGVALVVIKASTPTKKAAFAIALDADAKPVAATTFLLPDTDPSTMQSASIDKSLTVTKSITKKEGSEVVGEGKEVWAFDAKAKAFSLVVLDPLEDDAMASRNPIDTFPQTNKLAGDYLLGKKGIVSVRDGRYPNQLLVFIHTEKAGGDCVGQMKGEFTMTSTTTAAYRQGGDPCVLNLSFKGAAVAIAEGSGCGNYRGLDCPFAGTFTKKKQAAPKATAAKSRRR